MTTAMPNQEPENPSHPDPADAPEVPARTPPRRRLRVVLGGLALGLVVLIALGFLDGKPPRAPVVQGRPLDFWLRELVAGTAARREAAEKVLLGEGASHLEWIVQTLDREPSLAGRLLLQTEDWLPRSLSARLHQRFRPYEVAVDQAGAAMVLGLLGNTNTQVVTLLGEALLSADLRLAGAAASSLGQLGRPGTSRLLASLHDLSGVTRLTAIARINPTNTTAATAMPVILAEALREPNAGVLPAYSHVIAGFGGEAARAVYAILPGQNAADTERVVELAAAAAKRDYAFLRAWDDLWAAQPPAVRLSGLEVLRRLQAYSVRRAVMFARGLCDSDARVREAGLQGLITVRENARRAVPVLLTGLESDSLDIKLAAVRALGQLGPVATEARPVLESLATSPEAGVRQAARAALSLVDPSAKSRGPGL